jgi:hypothetical protein
VPVAHTQLVAATHNPQSATPQYLLRLVIRRYSTCGTVVCIPRPARLMAVRDYEMAGKGGSGWWKWKSLFREREVVSRSSRSGQRAGLVFGVQATLVVGWRSLWRQ